VFLLTGLPGTAIEKDNRWQLLSLYSVTWGIDIQLLSGVIPIGDILRDLFTALVIGNDGIKKPQWGTPGQ